MIPWPFSIAIKVNTFLPGKVKNSLLLKLDQKCRYKAFFPFNPISFLINLRMTTGGRFGVTWYATFA